MKAMIFAAGRGERMRPLTDRQPKPLLEAGGKALIVWQIEALARAGFNELVINHAWLGEHIEAALGDGSSWGVRIHYSAEGKALETAGGVAQALPLLRGAGDVFAAVSADIHTDFDYHRLHATAAAMAASGTPRMHLVMVPNPAFHPQGDFSLGADGRLHLDEPTPETGVRLTFGNIGLYDLRLFGHIEAGSRLAMTPLYHAAIRQGRASGERHDGRWANVGTPAQLAELDACLRARGAAGRTDSAIIRP